MNATELKLTNRRRTLDFIRQKSLEVGAAMQCIEKRLDEILAQ